MRRDPGAVEREDLRALAAAVLAQALRDFEGPADAIAEEREELAAFLLDPADPRLATWCAPLGLDPDAVRGRLRRRLRRREGDRGEYDGSRGGPSEREHSATSTALSVR